MEITSSGLTALMKRVVSAALVPINLNAKVYEYQ